MRRWGPTYGLWDLGNRVLLVHQLSWQLIFFFFFFVWEHWDSPSSGHSGDWKARYPLFNRPMSWLMCDSLLVECALMMVPMLWTLCDGNSLMVTVWRQVSDEDYVITTNWYPLYDGYFVIITVWWSLYTDDCGLTTECWLPYDCYCGIVSVICSLSHVPTVIIPECSLDDDHHIEI